MIHPYKTQPLQYNSGRAGQTPHEESLCEMCQQLGQSCRNYTPQERTELVLVEADEQESILSFGSTSTNSEDYPSDDNVTPVPSDTEDLLEDEFKNLKLRD